MVIAASGMTRASFVTVAELTMYVGKSDMKARGLTDWKAGDYKRTLPGQP